MKALRDYEIRLRMNRGTALSAHVEASLVLRRSAKALRNEQLEDYLAQVSGRTVLQTLTPRVRFDHRMVAIGVRRNVHEDYLTRSLTGSAGRRQIASSKPFHGRPPTSTRFHRVGLRRHSRCD